MRRNPNLRVLIVGAGPSGLTAAIELTRRGVPVRIIDKAPDFADQSRAIGINPRTLAILEPCGASELLLQEGTRIGRANVRYPGGHIARLDVSRLKCPHPYMLALPQSRTERILGRVLKELGVTVEHDVSLVDYKQAKPGLRCELQGPDGVSFHEATHLIGADGSHSIVRDKAGIGFPGDTLKNDWILADIRMDWPFPTNELNIFIARKGFLFTITLGDDRFRIVSPSTAPESYLPNGVRIKETIWKSAFRVQHRQATTYQSGCVFLAGDAAHVHSPLGARGMNMGIADAATFAWLLTEGREDDYTRIRHPIGARTIAFVKRQTHQMISDSQLQRRLAAIVAPIALKIHPVHSFAVRAITGLIDPQPEWL